MANKQAQVSVLMSLISSIVAYFHILRIRQTAGTCFALKSMLNRRRHRFQIVFAFTCGHRKRFTNGNVWTRINLKTDKYLSVFKFIRIRMDGALVAMKSSLKWKLRFPCSRFFPSTHFACSLA